MTKQEFITEWSKVRKAALREMYKDDPHGTACLVAALADMPAAAEKLWKRYRESLKDVDVEAYFARLQGIPTLAQQRAKLKAIFGTKP